MFLNQLRYSSCFRPFCCFNCYLPGWNRFRLLCWFEAFSSSLGGIYVLYMHYVSFISILNSGFRFCACMRGTHLVFVRFYRCQFIIVVGAVLFCPKTATFVVYHCAQMSDPMIRDGDDAIPTPGKDQSTPSGLMLSDRVCVWLQNARPGRCVVRANMRLASLSSAHTAAAATHYSLIAACCVNSARVASCTTRALFGWPTPSKTLSTSTRSAMAIVFSTGWCCFL